MKDKKFKFYNSFWAKFLVSLTFATICAVIFIDNWIPAAALGYAISTKLLSELSLNHAKSQFNIEKINILKRFCADKIGLARNLSINKKDSALIYCLAELEFLTTEIANCCDHEVDKDNFKKVKGLLGSTKTTFDVANFDETITKPYEDVIQCVSELESYLNDI